jgi:hypothetical protein
MSAAGVPNDSCGAASPSLEGTKLPSPELRSRNNAGKRLLVAELHLEHLLREVGRNSGLRDWDVELENCGAPLLAGCR